VLTFEAFLDRLGKYNELSYFSRLRRKCHSEFIVNILLGDSCFVIFILDKGRNSTLKHEMNVCNFGPWVSPILIRIVKVTEVKKSSHKQSEPVRYWSGEMRRVVDIN
jgi:hypothetical protein